VRLLPPLTTLLDAGQHPSVRGLLAEIGVEAVYFPDERLFLNANTPNALAALERAA
jgi:molybdopterin-guanine dinucleotide biosynthesis protein A